MRTSRPTIPLAACCWAIALTAAVLGGLPLGVEPVGGDPDRMYRPIKAELARGLADGRSPFWSDLLGLGYPLAAESHAAAFYPPNQILYRGLSVPAAYRASMFIHYLLMAGATYGYAGALGLSPHGAALAALSFVFCGFQSIHSSHEWAYHALAYLPLALLATERIMNRGGLGWTATLAAIFGLQLTLGHFQVQSWTAGLVAATALWRSIESPRRARRFPLAFAALAWGAAIAAVQLGPTWELTGLTGYDHRSFRDLAFYGFPPAHWAELVVPGWFRGIPGGPEAGYWYAQGTTGYEACLYVGTIPLIFAFLGLTSRPDRGTIFWIAATSLTLSLAALPTISLPAYAWVTSLPGLGLFRAPGRFLAVTSLGLAILAGKGMDRRGGRPLAWIGLGLALAFAAAGMAWVVSWSWRPDHVRELGGDRLLIRLATAAGAWLAATILVAAWLRGRSPAPLLLIATAIELGTLFYTSTTDWGWSVSVPGSSPILAELDAEPDVGKVAGMLSDIPMRLGSGVISPYTGFPALPPHGPFAAFNGRDAGPGLAFGDLRDARRRFGVTHGVWDVPVESPDAELVAEGPDATLDRIASRPPGSAPQSRWRLYRFKKPRPSCLAIPQLRFRETGADGVEYAQIYDYRRPPFDAEPLKAGEFAPNATQAEVISWDGWTAVVEHDGPCHVLVNRTVYPGWTYRIDDGPETPILQGNLAPIGVTGDQQGVQAAFAPGAGTHRITFSYRPTNLHVLASLSLASTALALITIGRSFARRRSAAPEDDAEAQDHSPGQHRLQGG